MALVSIWIEDQTVEECKGPGCGAMAIIAIGRASQGGEFLVFDTGNTGFMLVATSLVMLMTQAWPSSTVASSAVATCCRS